MSIRHIVLWKVSGPDAETRTANGLEICRRLNALQGVVPEIERIDVRPNIAYPDANFDVALVAEFADIGALERYQVHPAHEAVVGFIRSVTAGRSAVDLQL